MIRLRAILLAVVVSSIFSTATSTQAPARKKVLFLTHAALYKHASLEPAETAVTEKGKAAGFDVTTVRGYAQDSRNLDLTFLTPEYLAQFDALMLMTNGNLPLTPAQKQGIIAFVRGGKGLIGVHCATLTMYDYPEFGEMLGGYYLRSIVPTQLVDRGKVGVLKVEDQNHPATRMLGASWPINEEFYQFGTAVFDPSKPTENVSQVGRLPIPLAFSRERVHVLLSLDTEHTDLSDIAGPGLQKGGDYPQAWTRNFGSGRVFYTTLGHRADIWEHDAVFRAHVTGGILWALGIDNR
jgi:type 1 glutamine amidotransferase